MSDPDSPVTSTEATNVSTLSSTVDLINIATNLNDNTTNEQGVLNLYFLFINNKYVELENYINGKLSYFYWKLDKSEVIITKSLTQKNK